MFLGILAGALLVLPVFVTVGIHLGVENQKLIALIQGKPPPGQIADPTGSGSYVPRVKLDQQFCQKAYGFEPFPYRYLCEYSTFHLKAKAVGMQTRLTRGRWSNHPSQFPTTLDKPINEQPRPHP